jgi:hypothetical protein
LSDNRPNRFFHLFVTSYWAHYVKESVETIAKRFVKDQTFARNVFFLMPVHFLLARADLNGTNWFCKTSKLNV